MDINTTPSRQSNVTYTLNTPYFSTSFVAFVLTLYSLILLIGTIGNLMTCAVVFTKRSMRRSIHFYTFNLAVADWILLVIYIPTQMKQLVDQMSWNMGASMCRLAYFVIPLCLSASISTLIAISIDRFRGFRNPIHWRAESQKNVRYLLPLIWVISVGTAIPVTYYAKLEPHGDFIFCRDEWPSHKLEITYWSIMMVLQYILPLLFIACVHVYMAWRISNGNEQINRLHKRMMVMVILLLATYSVCTGLQHVNYFMGLLHNIHQHSIGPYFFIFSNLAVSLQACLNPFIYGLTRSDYKENFKNIIKYFVRNVRKIIFKNDTVVKELSRENTTTDSSLTPMLFRKPIQGQLNLGQANSSTHGSSLTVPSLYAVSTTNENGNEAAGKRTRDRLNTLAYLDLSALNPKILKQKTTRTRPSSLRRIGSLFRKTSSAKATNYEEIVNIDTPPPQIRISITRHETIKRPKQKEQENADLENIEQAESLENIMTKSNIQTDSKGECLLSEKLLATSSEVANNSSERGKSALIEKHPSYTTQTSEPNSPTFEADGEGLHVPRKHSGSLLIFADVQRKNMDSGIQRGSLTFSVAHSINNNGLSLPLFEYNKDSTNAPNSINKTHNQTNLLENTDPVNTRVYTPNVITNRHSNDELVAMSEYSNVEITDRNLLQENNSIEITDQNDFDFLTDFLRIRDSRRQFFMDSIKESPL